MRRPLTLALALVIAISSAASAREGGNVNLNINVGAPVVAEPAPPPPPRVVLRAAPRFIFLPFLDMYVSVGIPYDIVYIDGSYYLYEDGYWYRGPFYDGPWVLVEFSRLPGPLHRHRLEQIRHHRDDEFSRFEREREHYQGRWHEPKHRGEERGEHDRGEHREHRDR
jgi:hypothetical protein